MNSQQSYFTPSLPTVVDVWPNGFAFGNADVWAHPALTQTESERLDHLIGLALVDAKIRDRLIVQHDPSLLDAFDLTEVMRQWLASVKAGTLEELAQAIVATSNPSRRWQVSQAA